MSKVVTPIHPSVCPSRPWLKRKNPLASARTADPPSRLCPSSNPSSSLASASFLPSFFPSFLLSFLPSFRSSVRLQALSLSLSVSVSLVIDLSLFFSPSLSLLLLFLPSNDDAHGKPNEISADLAKWLIVE